jgi:uncharacterized protein (DUF4415 family)
MKQAKKPRGKKVIYDVTEENYRGQLARGIAPEYALKPGRHVFKRGGYLERHPEIPPRTGSKKVSVTMRFDPDVLEHFKRRASESGSAGYQTLINEVLRGAMEREKSAAVPAPLDALINNEQFIAAVAAKVARKRT